MRSIYPKKLKKGDKIAVVAPSRSMAIISEETRDIANKRFNDLGLEIIYGKNIDNQDEFNSTSIEQRVEDLHWTFSDSEINGILTAIGGFNSNQLLRYIDWNLIKNNPKVFCGFSDISTLNNAILKKTGLVTYSGPHYSSFGQKLHFDYTLEYFKKCVMSDQEFEIKPSDSWSDDLWFIDQDDRQLENNQGYVCINPGKAKGKIIGAHARAITSIQGTEYLPDFQDSILFLEDDCESKAHHFDRSLQSIIHQLNFKKIKGIVIGRFQKESDISIKLIKSIIKSKKALRNIPVIANVDFGHTDPKITFPIGGEVEIVSGKQSAIHIKAH